MTAFTVDVVIALKPGQRMSLKWWRERYEWGARRAGAMPPEVADPSRAILTRQTDPDSGDRFACVTLPLPDGTGLGRAREIAHMLTSVLAAEGFTLRRGGQRDDALPGEFTGEPEGALGAPSFTEGRVCSSRCLACVFASDTRIGCCTEGAAFSLADLGARLLAGDEAFVARCLALPGEIEDTKWHPYLSRGSCVFHDPARGCTLGPAQMPLQCRTYLCAPDQLLPAEPLAEYTAYVDALEEAETFIEEHMRIESGVDFGSPLDALKAAAAKAFAAWKAGE